MYCVCVCVCVCACRDLRVYIYILYIHELKYIYVDTFTKTGRRHIELNYSCSQIAQQRFPNVGPILAATLAANIGPTSVCLAGQRRYASVT